MAGGRRKRLGEEEYARVQEAEAKELEINQPKETREEIFAEVERLEGELYYCEEGPLRAVLFGVLGLLKRNL